MSVSLIISYYNSTEFIKLLEIVPHHWTIFIYNKSNKPLSLSLPSTNLKIINLENKGRETDTYLNHIIFNYYDLYDYNIFIQDDTHNHIQDYHGFIQFANNFFNSKNTFIQYPAKYRKGTTQPQQRTIHSGIHSSNIHIPKDSILTTASLFILLNSIFGIFGQLTKDNIINELSSYLPLFLVVLIGGLIGNYLNIKIFSNRTLTLITSLLVILVAFRMGLKLFYN